MVRIPSEYQEVEYLKSTGTQRIDLPFGFDPTDGVEIRGSTENGFNDKYMVAPITWNNDNNRFAMLGGINNVFCFAFGSRGTPNSLLQPSVPGDTQIHTMTYSNKVFTMVDTGSVADMTTASFGSTSANLRLFYGYGNLTRGKIAYYHHKKANGTEINLIPCYRKSDNVPGMYDTVSKTFFTNSGTGTFLVGNDVNYSNTNLLEVRRRILLNTPHVESMSGNPAIFTTDMAANLKECKIRFTPVQAGEGTPSPENVRPISGWDGVSLYFNCRLPNEYQEVEWIGTDDNATANAYINTGLQTSEDLKFTVDFQANRVNGRYIMGYYNKDGTSFYLYYGAASTFQTAFGTKWTNTSLKSDSDRHEFIYEFKNGYLNVTHNGDTILTKEADFSTPQTIYVVGAVDKSKTSSKTYSVTMSKNGTLIQNLIPCYRKSDGEIGMFDTVSKTFFTNAGTGVFLKGNDIPSTGQIIDVAFPQTIYGGYVDLIKGEIVEEWTKIGLPTTGWSKQTYNSFSSFSRAITGKQITASTVDSGVICDRYNTYETLPITQLNKLPDMSICGRSTYAIIFIKDTNYENASDFQSSLVDAELAYLLATPNVYPLTPQTIKALKGLNNLYSDANGNIEVKFWKH